MDRTDLGLKPNTQSAHDIKFEEQMLKCHEESKDLS